MSIEDAAERLRAAEEGAERATAMLHQSIRQAAAEGVPIRELAWASDLPAADVLKILGDDLAWAAGLDVADILRILG